MTELKNQLIALGVTILTVVVGYAVLWIRSKVVNGKINKLKPLNELLDSELPKYFKPVLQNIYQKYIKQIYKTEQWTAEKQLEVFDKAFEELINIIPDFIIKIASQIKSNWKEMLKVKLHQFLEINKGQINAEPISNGMEA